MHNLSFWNSAVDVIDALSSIEGGGNDLTPVEILESFIETYRGLFDPSNDFEEYVLVSLVDRVNRHLLLDKAQEKAQEKAS